MKHLLALSVLCAACGTESPTGVSRAAVIGGSPTEGDDAVVMLVAYPDDHTSFATCTASLVAPDVLLTAAHCVDPDTHAGDTFGVFVGPDASAYTTANTLIPQLVPVKEAHVHPDYERTAPFYADIAVVILETARDTPPLAMNREPLTEANVGSSARIVGYGQIQYNVLNTVKHTATTELAALGDVDTVVVGDVDHRSCIGDSGGPALVVIDGVETIVGVDSYAELSGCLEPAHYRRPDAFTAFLDDYVPPPDDPGTGGAGGAGAGVGGSGGGVDQLPPVSDDGGCAIGGTRHPRRWPLGVWAALAFMATRRWRARSVIS